MIQFRELLQRLSEQRVEFIVIGGVAAALHGSPVATFDIDVTARMDSANFARIIAALRDLDPRFRFHPKKPPMPLDPAKLEGFRNLNLITTIGPVDLLGNLPDIATFDELAGHTVDIDLDGFTVRVLDLDTLIAAKKAAGRDKDKMNIWHLEVIRKMKREQPGLFDTPGKSEP